MATYLTTLKKIYECRNIDNAVINDVVRYVILSKLTFLETTQKIYFKILTAYKYKEPVKGFTLNWNNHAYFQKKIDLFLIIWFMIDLACASLLYYQEEN